MGNQSAEAITSFRRNLQSSTRQAAKDPAKLKQIIYKLKNEWVRIMDAYPEVGDVGNAQYLRALLKPGAMQYSGEAAPQYLRTLVETLGWVEKELRTKDKSAKAVVAAAKANGVKKSPPRSPSALAKRFITELTHDVNVLNASSGSVSVLRRDLAHAATLVEGEARMLFTTAVRVLDDALAQLEEDRPEQARVMLNGAIMILKKASRIR